MKAIFKKNIIIFLSIVITSVSAPSISTASPRVIVRQQDYRISGNNIDEIKRAISEQAPTQNDGRAFSALTKYDISWNYTFDKSGKNCKIDTVTTSVVITHSFPKLENINQLDMSTQTQWNDYFSSLQTHEKNHASMGIEAASEIEKEISRIKPTTTCTKLAIEANNLARSIINYYHNKNMDYDKETVHGLLQGATLPNFKTF